MDYENIEAFKKAVLGDPTVLEELYRKHEASEKVEEKTYADAMTEFTANLIKTTEDNVEKMVTDIVEKGIEKARVETLATISAKMGLTEDREVLMSDLPGIFRKMMLDLEDGKKSDEGDLKRDEPPTPKMGELPDIDARFKEMKGDSPIV